MKIKITDYLGKTIESTIAAYVEREIDGGDYGIGQLESAAKTAKNAGVVLGRLIETLAEKGVITLPNVEEIVYGYPKENITNADE